MWAEEALLSASGQGLLVLFCFCVLVGAGLFPTVSGCDNFLVLILCFERCYHYPIIEMYSNLALLFPTLHVNLQNKKLC